MRVLFENESILTREYYLKMLVSIDILKVT